MRKSGVFILGLLLYPNVGLDAAQAATRTTVPIIRPSRAAATPVTTVTTTTNPTPARGSTARVASRTVSSSPRDTTIRRTAQKSVTARSTIAPAAVIARDDTDQLTQTCTQQYTQCMDNYCNVLDEAQGRCSCSANLKNYTKTEAALKQATENLRDIAQKIQYIGLTADEITALFTQTESESAMVSTSDTSQLKNDLDKIKSLIVDVSNGRATAANTGASFDLSGLLNLSLSGTSGFDLGLFSASQTGASINNQRGEQLYKTAAARCQASVLNNCTAQGVDAAVIRNAYDLEIDKQCIQYERNLIQQNNQMVSTIRNANGVLQRARLMVGQQKNSYDARGCVAALDQCMQDDVICGTDYENCLDPTGKYIVNGDIVVGQPIGHTTLSDADIDTMLRTKIGRIDDRGHATGLCAGVMLKCRAQTMPDDKYNDNNPVITEYLARARRLIRSARSARVSTYATECLRDVSTCLNQNNTSSTWGYQASDTAINACRAIITTCRSAMGYETDANDATIKQWVQDATGITFAAKPLDAYKLKDVLELIPDAVPNINTYQEGLSGAELSTMRAEDTAACLSIPGAKISKSGGLCIVFGLNTSFTYDDMRSITTKAVAAYGGVALHDYYNYECLSKQPDNTVEMYVMRFAYYEAQKECKERGGKIVPPLGNSDSSFLSCKDVPVSDQAACDAFLSIEDRTAGPYSENNTNYNKDSGKCAYVPQNVLYWGREFPGTCLYGAYLDEFGDCIYHTRTHK